MNLLLKLNDGCYIRPEEVSEVTINRDADTLTVRMNNGIGHAVQKDYGQSIYATCDRVVAAIERTARPAFDSGGA